MKSWSYVSLNKIVRYCKRLFYTKKELVVLFYSIVKIVPLIAVFVIQSTLIVDNAVIFGHIVFRKKTYPDANCCHVAVKYIVFLWQTLSSTFTFQKNKLVWQFRFSPYKNKTVIQFFIWFYGVTKLLYSVLFFMFVFSNLSVIRINSYLRRVLRKLKWSNLNITDLTFECVIRVICMSGNMLREAWRCAVDLRRTNSSELWSRAAENGYLWKIQCQNPRNPYTVHHRDWRPQDIRWSSQWDWRESCSQCCCLLHSWGNHGLVHIVVDVSVCLNCLSSSCYSNHTGSRFC